MLKIIQNYQDIAFYPFKIPAGFPSPADDYLEGDIDLMSHIIKRPSSTFVMQVTGNSMVGAGLMSGDYIAVDRSVSPVSGHTVVAILDGDMTVKRFEKRTDGHYLVPANKHYSPIKLDEENPPEIFGVVVGVVRKCV